jgi:hypothetical protein
MEDFPTVSTLLHILPHSTTYNFFGNILDKVGITKIKAIALASKTKFC